MSTAIIPDEVRSILANARIDGCAVRLPPGQLDRTLYTAVNDVLERLGGKWSKTARAHLFATPPDDTLAQAIASGVKPTKNPDAFFPTPSAVVAEMMQYAPDSVTTMLEPSAGTGAIATAMQGKFPSARLHCVEIHAGRAEVLLARTGTIVWTADFLKWHAPERYEFVAMNPPFAVERLSAEWMAHVRRAHAMLADGGRLVAIVPNGFEHRSDRRHTEFRRWARPFAVAVEPLDDDAFRESGTGVRCMMLVLSLPSGSR